MKDIIYLVVNRQKVVTMRKSLGRLERGEIPVKVNVEVKEAAFREPTIERNIVVDDWTEGIELSDVAFEKNVITEKEAEMIRKNRLVQMREVLEANGYTVEEKPGDEE